MKEKNFYGTFKNIIETIFSSPVFPFVTAAMSLLCYYTGSDIVAMYCLALCVALIVCFCRDVTPVICCFLFISILVSEKNSPSQTVGGSSYYFQPHIIAQIAVLIALDVAAIFYRFVRGGIRREIKLDGVFWGLVALSVAFLLNGVFSKGYKPMNALYGLFMAFFFLGIYTLIRYNADYSQQSLKRLGLYFAAFGATLACELIVKYLTTEGLFLNGILHRNLLMFGWGVYNTMGMFLVICIPPVTLLAAKCRHGWIFYVLSILLFVAALLSASRQAMIAALPTFAVSFILLMAHGGNRRANAIVTAVAAVLLVAFIIAFGERLWDIIEPLFSSLVVDGKPDGSGRWKLWKTAVDNFKSAPLFGIGFYVELAQDPGAVGLDIIPLMYHNTIMQLLASCGLAGVATYAVHRVQTVLCFVKNPSYDRAFLGLAILALLGMSLVDNHMFYIFPTMIYSSLVALLTKK